MILFWALDRSDADFFNKLSVKAKFAEIVKGEVQLRRISLLRTWVNKGANEYTGRSA